MPGAGIIGQHIEPDAMSWGFGEGPAEGEAKKRGAEAAPRPLHGDALEADIAVRVVEVAEDDKSPRLSRTVGADQIGVGRICERGAMRCLGPAADHQVIAWPALGGHDERNIFNTSAAHSRRAGHSGTSGPRPAAICMGLIPKNPAPWSGRRPHRPYWVHHAARSD